VNRAIAKLFVLVVVLFGILIAFTSRWTVFEATALRDNSENRRPILEEQKVKRGEIVADDGTTVLAKSVRKGQVYVRKYPTGSLFGHPIGFYDIRFNKSELERYRNDYLSGRNDAVGSFVDQLTGSRHQGAKVVTTLNVNAQKIAYQGLAGRRGAVVALDPRTGAVQVMASNPPFNANTIHTRGVNKQPGGLNRAVGAGYPPGSTFKVVTAIAAIDSGRYSPSSIVSGRNGKIISGTPLNNFGGEVFGDISLTDALTHSVNTVWAEVAEKLGQNTMQNYMGRLGFGADPPLDLPDADMRGSGSRINGKLVPATNGAIDVGRMGIGQNLLQVTPMQMAMVASSVANDGVLLRPHITDKIVDSDGRTVKTVEPEKMSTAMSPSTAKKVNTMMQSVVREGTGTQGALNGIDVAGKTGTAEVNKRCPNQAWFIGFAPANNPRVAVAVTIECTPGQGGTVAAPIARSVMQSLLKD
jgi:peptidoglycan glycosyltransferase